MTDGTAAVSNRTYLAEPSGAASFSSSESWKPVQGTTMDQASTQRWR